MPNAMGPSEYGGKTQRNGIQPPVSPSGMKGHTPTADEKQRLLHSTGQTEDSTSPPDGGEAFSGILPLREAQEKAPKPPLYKDVNG